MQGPVWRLPRSVERAGIQGHKPVPSHGDAESCRMPTRQPWTAANYVHPRGPRITSSNIILSTRRDLAPPCHGGVPPPGADGQSGSTRFFVLAKLLARYQTRRRQRVRSGRSKSRRGLLGTPLQYSCSTLGVVVRDRARPNSRTVLETGTYLAPRAGLEPATRCLEGSYRLRLPLSAVDQRRANPVR